MKSLIKALKKLVLNRIVGISVAVVTVCANGIVLFTSGYPYIVKVTLAIIIAYSVGYTVPSLFYPGKK